MPLRKPTKVSAATKAKPIMPSSASEPSSAQASTSVETNSPMPATGVSLPGLKGTVRRVNLVFDIFSGADRRLTGKGRHSYVNENGENYGVEIVQDRDEDQQSTDESWRISISGRVTSTGLSPVFLDVQGAAAHRMMGLNEREKSSSVGSGGSPRRGRMPDGLLDRQSLIYQFMLKPPDIAGGDLWLSDGVTHRLFSYRFAGFDSLPIEALGGSLAIKLVLTTSESTETIELWIVPDMHYLPVKVRHVDSDGVVTEQVVVSLDFQ